MRKLNAKPLTADAFRKYGTYSRMINPDGERLGPPPVEFYRDLVHVNLGSGIPCASVTRVSPRPMIAEKFEYHTATAEAFMPIDGDVIIHIAPAGKAAAVPYDKIEAFSVPKGTMVMMHAGVWHAAPFACADTPVHILVFLPERTYANDCSVVLFPEEEKLELRITERHSNDKNFDS